MTIEEVVQDYIRETVKPLTPDQARIKALQGNVDRARLALQTARDQQRQRRESERRASSIFRTQRSGGAKTAFAPKPEK